MEEGQTLWYAFASVLILGLRPPHQEPIVVVLRPNNEFDYLAGDRASGLFIQDTFLGPLILLPPNTGPAGCSAVDFDLCIGSSSSL
jgi:hypothetical protein